jgi:hypothetical protein
MNPPTAPSPKPALTNPVRLMVRMAPASLSEVLPSGCAVPNASYPRCDSIDTARKEQSEPRSGTHRTWPAPSSARRRFLAGGSGLVLLGVTLEETLLQDRPFARSE